MTRSTYNLRQLSFGEAIIAETAAAMSEDYKASLRQVVATNALPDYLQFPTAATAELVTLGELMKTGENEHAEQFFDERALRKVLIGRYGIAKSSQRGQDHCRLALPIQLCYLRAPFTEALTRPIISSGRHRLLALLALLYAAGVEDTTIKKTNVRVSTIIVADAHQFAQLMENNNTSRTQSRHEIKVHALSGKGIPTDDADSLLEFNYRCTDAATQAEFFAQLVSLLSRGREVNGDPRFAFDVASSAWSAVKLANRADRKFIPDLFSDVEDLQDVAQAVADAIPGAYEEAAANPLAQGLVVPVGRALALVLADKLKVSRPEFPSFEEEAQALLQRRKDKVAELERALQR